MPPAATANSIPADWLFPSSLTEAAQIQQLLAQQVVVKESVENLFASIRYIGGMDVSNNLRDPQQMIHAAVVVFDRQTLQLVDTASASIQQKFPYIPGFLGFREAPVLVAAYQKLQILPDIILVDGHGICHPRGLGIASHIGVLLNCPTIGVAKSILVGNIAGELAETAGAEAPLLWKQQQIGVVLRSKVRANPLIISPGHQISFSDAVNVVKHCLTRYRLPEPTRLAHQAANVCRRAFSAI